MIKLTVNKDGKETSFETEHLIYFAYDDVEENGNVNVKYASMGDFDSEVLMEVIFGDAYKDIRKELAHASAERFKKLWEADHHEVLDDFR